MKVHKRLIPALSAVLFVGALGEPARAEVTGVTVGLHTTCPYGLIA